MYNVKDDLLDSFLPKSNGDLFVQEDRPLVVEASPKTESTFETLAGLGGYVKYHARTLTPLGKKAGNSIGEECFALAERKLGYNRATRKANTRWNNALVDVLFEQIYPVLQAEESQQWTPAGALVVYQYDNEYFQKCYDAAVTKNPSLDKKRAEELEALGKAQPGTHDAAGKSKSKEETDPLG